MLRRSRDGERLEDEGGGRWERARRATRGEGPGSVPFLVIVVVPILIGAAVVLIAGRGVGFEVVRRRTVHKFPDVQWIDRAELARWREDSGRTQPLLLDARTKVEYQVSHLRDAVLDRPARPSLRPLRGRRPSDPIVVYCSVGYRGARLAHWLAGQGYYQRAEPGRRASSSGPTRTGRCSGTGGRPPRSIPTTSGGGCCSYPALPGRRARRRDPLRRALRRRPACPR